MQVQQDFSSTLIPQQQISGELQGFLLKGIIPSRLSFRVALDKIPCEKRVFEFSLPIELQFTQDDESWSCEACGIESFGADPGEAAASFCEDFGVLWDEIAQQPDEVLTASALETKNCILKAVKSAR